MNTLSKKLFISVLTLILTVGAFTATTFAWFTLGNQATVGQVTGNVSAGDGLEISINETEWFTNMSSTYIQNFIDDKYDENSLVLNAVTSVDGITMTKPGFLDVSTVSEGEYLEFEIFFRSVQPGTVKWNEVELTSDGVPFVVDTAYTAPVTFGDPASDQVTVGVAKKFYAANALRISVQTNGASTATVVQANEGANMADALYGNSLGAGNFVKGAHSYYQNKTGENITAVAPSLPTTIKVSDVAAGVNALVLVEDGDYYVGSVTVRVWVEGWDYEAFNAIFKDKISFTLGFVKA